MEARFFATPAEFHAWLEQHHETADELWVGFYKKHSRRPGLTWSEAVDEALCHGWIDGIRKSIDDESYRIRFTPRRPGSIWSAANVRRVQALIDEGRMRPAGLAAFGRRREDRTGRYSFEQENVELGEVFEAEFRANAEAWAFFEAQPPSYRRKAVWWVVGAKREETRRRRLATLIEDSAAGRRIALARRASRKS